MDQPTARQIEFAGECADVLGVDVRRELQRLGLRGDRRGYGLLIEWMVWANKRRAYLSGTETRLISKAAA